MRIISLLSALLLALLAVGCSDTKTYSFQVSVKNATNRPLTIWLVKEGPPAEQGWRSPEQLAMSVPGHEERISGKVLPPGKTADTGAIEGKFDPGTYAWLRVYDGPQRLSDILAVSRGNPARVDVPLDPGENRFIVTDQVGRIVVLPDHEPPATAPSK
jgi:hypothetical protein